MSYMISTLMSWCTFAAGSLKDGQSISYRPFVLPQGLNLVFVLSSDTILFFCSNNHQQGLTKRCFEEEEFTV